MVKIMIFEGFALKSKIIFYLFEKLYFLKKLNFKNKRYKIKIYVKILIFEFKFYFSSKLKNYFIHSK
jgi:hypothetical protein